MGRRSFPAQYEKESLTDLVHRNIGVLQTTVAEMVTVKEHQRM